MGTWVTPSVKCPTSPQVMISRFTSSSPTFGSMLTEPGAQSLGPALDSVSPSLCPSPARAHTHVLAPLSLSKINIEKLKKNK